MFRKISLCMLLLTTILHAAFVDDDMDGVANEDDRCPDSEITDIVGADGCAVEKISFKREHHGDISIGYAYSRYDDNLSQKSRNLSVGYAYGNFSAWLYASDYDLKTGESGAGDTTLALYYRGERGSVGYKIGIGSYLPTEKSSGNRNDYFVETRLSYYYERFDAGVAYQHTFMRDDATRDSDRATIHGGYIASDKLYAALSYTTQNSIYQGEGSLQNIALFVNYSLATAWFVSLSLSKGLSESATDLYSGINVGYYF